MILSGLRHAILVAGFAGCASSSVRAAACPVPVGGDPSLAAVPNEARLEYLTEGLQRARKNLRMWTHLWAITWAATTGVEVEVALTARHKGIREDEWVQAASTALGLVPVLILPPRVSVDPPFEAKGETCAEVARAEKLLAAYVPDDHQNTGAFAHSMNVATNLAVTIFLAAVYHHAEAAADSFAWGFPAGELMIQTYPKTITHLRENYLRGELNSPAKATQTSWLERTRVAFAPLTGGATLGVSFRY